MREVSAGSQAQAEHLVSGIDHCHISGQIRLGTGVRLHVGMLCSEQFLGSFDRQRLNFIYVLTAAVIASAGITFRVFVGENCAHRSEDRRRHDVLGSYQFNVAFLSVEFSLDRLGNFRVRLGYKRDAFLYETQSTISFRYSSKSITSVHGV